MQQNVKSPVAGPREYVAGAIVASLSAFLSDPQRRRRIGSSVQLFVGIFLLVFGYWIGRDHCRLLFFGVKTHGKLVGYQQQDFPNSGGVHWNSASMPVIEFEVQQRTVRFRDWVGSNFRTPMGGLVGIFYDPERPSNAMIDRPVMNWIPWAPVTAVGTILLISEMRQIFVLNRRP
jgi:hypothetical protein